MSSSDRITRSKGQSEGLSLPARTRQRRKSTNKEPQQDMDQQPTGFAEGLDQLQLFMYHLYQLNHPGLLLPSLLQVPLLDRDHPPTHYL